jgi:putative salt-induced outer membrane protein
MRNRRWVAVLASTMGLTLALVATPVLADWTGKGEAGLVIASGNTETETANAKLAMAREAGQWKNAFGLAGLYASDVDGRTAQRWEAMTQTDYNFTPRTFWFGAARYEDDQFSGFEYQATVSSGLGRKFIDTPETKFVGTAGAGYKFFETRDTLDPDTNAVLIPGDSDSEVVFRGTLDFDHKFTATTSLLDKFIVESGSNNTFVQNDIQLQVKMTDVLALAVGYSVRHNTDPPPGFEKTDTLTTVNLVYEIK